MKNRSMTLKTKFSLLIPASCMLLLAFLAMQNVYGRAFIIFLIIFKYVYFLQRYALSLRAGASCRRRKDKTMKDIEKKRKKEQYVSEEMIRLYCRRTTRDMTERQGGCARTVRRFPNMRSFGARNVLYGKQNLLQQLQSALLQA